MITTFFRNINALTLYGSNLLTVDKNDLRPFGHNLKFLYLGLNQLEVLDSDLFDYTPNLEFFFVYYNKIKSVGNGTFDKLQRLSKLNFEHNSCAGGVARDRSAVINLIANIERQCRKPDPTTTTTTTEVPTTTTEVPTATTTTTPPKILILMMTRI